MFNKNHRCCHDNLNSPVPAQCTLCPAALAILPAAISSIGADILVCLPAMVQLSKLMGLLREKRKKKIYVYVK